MPFTFTMPKLSPTMEEGTIAKWHKKENEFVEAGDVLLEITTDKATVEHTALDEGWLRKILVHEEENATVNQAIAIFTEEKAESIEGYEPTIIVQKEEAVIPNVEKSTEKKEPISATATGIMQPQFIPEEPPLLPKQAPTLRSTRLIASPLARRLAKEKGVDLSTVKGSGTGGRIVAKDVEHAAPLGPVAFSRHHKVSAAAGSYEEIALTPMRKAIGKRLQESKTFIPHFYVKKTVKADALLTTRMQLKELGLKVSVNDLILRATALALAEHPEINSGFNSVSQKIIRFKTVDISVAVAIEGGLITPIIRQANYKNLGEIAIEVKELAEKARTNKLQEHEYKGGSFCISNLGMYGIDEFTAVINPPQAAILAIGGIQESAVVKEGQLAVGKTLTLTLSSDHRVIDGAAAAQFLTTLSKLLENPVALTLQ